jgi:hypothetical protein
MYLWQNHLLVVWMEEIVMILMLNLIYNEFR